MSKNKSEEEKRNEFRDLLMGDIGKIGDALNILIELELAKLNEKQQRDLGNPSYANDIKILKEKQKNVHNMQVIKIEF